MYKKLWFILLSLVVICTAFSNVQNIKSLELSKKRSIANERRQVFGGERMTNFNGLLSLHNVNKGTASIATTEEPHKLTIHQFIYVVLTSIFVTCLIVGDVIGVKIFEIQLPFKILGHKSIEHTCGMLTFPITFLLGDVINEYYGAKATKHTVYIGLAMSVLVFIVMNMAQALPYLNKGFNGRYTNYFIVQTSN